MPTAGFKPVPFGAPANEGFVITPSDTTDIPSIPAQGVKLHNYGAAGLVFVNFGLSGTNVPLFMPQGAFAPVLVTRVYASGLGAGVTLIGVC